MKYNFCGTELSWLVHLVKYSRNSGIKNFLILILELASENSQKNICGLRKLHLLCPSNVLYYNYCSNLIYIDTTYVIGWVAVKFGINTTSVVLKIKVSRVNLSEITHFQYSKSNQIFTANTHAIPC